MPAVPAVQRAVRAFLLPCTLDRERSSSAMPPKITDFKLDEVVWVKLGSYPWWPARVAEDQKGKL